MDKAISFYEAIEHVLSLPTEDAQYEFLKAYDTPGLKWYVRLVYSPASVSLHNIALPEGDYYDPDNIDGYGLTITHITDRLEELEKEHLGKQYSIAEKRLGRALNILNHLDVAYIREAYRGQTSIGELEPVFRRLYPEFFRG